MQVPVYIHHGLEHRLLLRRLVGRHSSIVTTEHGRHFLAAVALDPEQFLGVDVSNEVSNEVLLGLGVKRPDGGKVLVKPAAQGALVGHRGLVTQNPGYRQGARGFVGAKVPK